VLIVGFSKCCCQKVTANGQGSYVYNLKKGLDIKIRLGNKFE